MDIPTRWPQLHPFRRTIHQSATAIQILTTAWRRDQSIHFMVTKSQYHVWQYSLSWTWLYRAARWISLFRQKLLAGQYFTVNTFTFFMQDGTVNVHTIKDGQFIRTLKPLNCTGDFIQITYITLSYQGMQTIPTTAQQPKNTEFQFQLWFRLHCVFCVGRYIAFGSCVQHKWYPSWIEIRFRTRNRPHNG